MNILLTNDDGFQAAGLLELYKILKLNHSVCVVAPEIEHSGKSHAMTLRYPLLLRKHDTLFYSCSGTPVDCVLLVYHKAIPFEPDIVISGINRGPNLGTDIIYSGTAAAARQSAMVGVPGVAVSLAEFTEPFYYTALAQYICKNIHIFKELWEPGMFFNVNAPNADPHHQYTAQWTGLCKRVYKDKMEAVHTKGGTSYCFYTEGNITTIEDCDSDEYAVSNGKLSITPIEITPTLAHQWLQKHQICPRSTVRDCND